MNIPVLTKLFSKKAKPKIETKPYAPYEEVVERKTTKLGTVLLLIMVILGLIQGNDFLNSLAKDIKGPPSISHCGHYLDRLVRSSNKKTNRWSSQNGLHYYSSPGNRQYSNCAFSPLEQEYKIDKIITTILARINELGLLTTRTKNLQSKINQLSRSIDTGKQNYDITLQEKMARERQKVYNKTKVKDQLIQNESSIVKVRRDLVTTKGEVTRVQKSLKRTAREYQGNIEALFEEYRSELRWAEFKRALLQLLLIGPLLYLTLRKYLALKKVNSQYTIIWTAITSIFAILFAQVLVLFIYKIIPHQLFAKLVQFFSQFAFIGTILDYSLLVLTPVLFGGIVYLIQKKVYNKEAVMMRALKNHKCPSCSMSLRESDRYCAACHFQIKRECRHCQKDRIVGLTYCPCCGGS